MARLLARLLNTLIIAPITMGSETAGSAVIMRNTSLQSPPFPSSSAFAIAQSMTSSKGAFADEITSSSVIFTTSSRLIFMHPSLHQGPLCLF